jgi:hypothetical protein
LATICTTVARLLARKSSTWSAPAAWQRLQQQQPLGEQILLADRSMARERMVFRHHQVEGVVEQGHGREVVAPDRQRQDQEVQPAGGQGLDQMLGLALAQRQLHVGIAGVQPGQDLRQEIGADGRDHAEAERAGEPAVAMAGEIDQVLDRQQDLPRAPRDLRARGGEEHARRGTLDQDHAELRL